VPSLTGPLHFASARSIAAAVRARELSAEEVVTHHLDRIADASELCSFVTVDADGALARARAADRKREAPEGVLAGVPFAAKDCWDTAGVRTTYGSRIFSDRVPTSTAPAVQRLLDAGAIMIGKANLDEFARGVKTANTSFGQCRNPLRPGFTPCGSSGGNAAALAAGLVVLGLATDGGGSIRAPAAACGVSGYKPPFGRVPLEGAFPLAAPFDHAGPMARSLDDVALAMEALVGQRSPAARLRDLRIGVVAGTPDSATRALEEQGALVVAAAIPDLSHLIPFHLAEFAITHRDLYPARAEDYSPPARAMLELGRAVTAVEHRRLADRLAAWRRECDKALPFDVLVSPTIAGEPPRIDEPEDHAMLLRITTYTRPFNMLGWPAATARDGLMFAGRDEAIVLGAAIEWESTLAPRQDGEDGSP
jgi:Asp-tRNA(Asn)/Glu-tRNA(Gln) amidotransferase A subunit family amidase